MSERINTTIVAQFGIGGSGNSRSGIALVEDPEGTTEIGQTHIKVYPKIPPVFFVTAGKWRKVGDGEEEAQSAITFAGDNSASMPIYGSRNVTFTLQGVAYDATTFKPINVGFSYDAANGVMKASQKCYAVLLVNYIAPYSRVSYTFAGDGCPIEPVINTTSLKDIDGFYLPALVVAVDPSIDAKATLQLRPPQCTYNRDMSVRHRWLDRNLPKLVLELHDGERVKLSEDGDGISAGGIVRLYPASSGAKLSATFGVLESRKISRNVNMTETVVFNGGSTTLKYPPIAKPAVGTGNVKGVTAAGFTVDIRLATYGETVYIGNWDDKGSYTIAGDRIVEQDEVVPTTMHNVTIPVWATVVASYTTSYELYRYKPELTTQASRVATEGSIVAIADGNRTASLKIDPPVIGGSIRNFGRMGED